MRISTSMIYAGGGARIQKATADLLKTQQQVASGKRETDPVSAGRILQILQSESLNMQYQKNQDTADNSLRMMDVTLGALSQTLQDVRETVLQGVNASLSATDRQIIAGKLRSQLDALIALGNTRDSSGAFVFSGFKSSTQPFSGDSNTSVSYEGDSGQIAIQISPEGETPISFSGQEVFMDIPAVGGGKQSVFATVSTLATQIEAGGANLADSISDSLGNLDAGLDNIIAVRARAGSYLNMVEASRGLSENGHIENQKILSVLQDVDYAEALSVMAKQQTVLDAAQKSLIKIMSLSLFNKL